MEMKIKGSYFKSKNTPLGQEMYGEWTVKEIADFVQHNHEVTLILSGYEVRSKEGVSVKSMANSLTLYENKCIPTQEGEIIIVPVEFQRYKLGIKFEKGDPHELVKVDCLVDIHDEKLSVRIYNMAK